MPKKLFKKAVLIYPKFQDNTFWSFIRTLKRYLPMGEHGLPKRFMPPLGLMGLYNHLNKNYMKEGFYDELVLVDRNVDPTPLEDIVAKFDHVYMGGMITQEKSLIEDTNIIKKKFPEKIMVIGGTAIDKNSPLMEMAHHLIEGEAEVIIDGLVKGIFNGTAKKYNKGIPAPPEKFFIPDYSSINLKNYINTGIQLSRGCPEDCEFCDITARFGRVPRLTPGSHIETIFKQLDELNAKISIFFVDDNYIGNPTQNIKILKMIDKLEEKIGHRLPKYTELTMRIGEDTPIMEEMREWLRKTNVNMYFIGVESSNIESLIETGKVQNLKGKNSLREQLFDISKKTGATITIGMIAGFDSDTEQSIITQADFINSLHTPVVMFGNMIALPHTKLYERLKKEGRLVERSKGNNTGGEVNFIPKQISAKNLEKVSVKVLKKIYTRKAFFGRVMNELSVFNPKYTDDIRPKEETMYIAKKLLTDWRYTPTFLFHALPAHIISQKRFGFMSPKYLYAMGTYFTHCAKFIHFKGQTEYLEREQKHRTYEPWQLYSWEEIQKSKIASIDVLEDSIKSPSLYEKVKMTLDNGYELVGTRIEALKHFVEPHLKEGLYKLKDIKVPSLKNFIDTEMDIYHKINSKRPEILENIDFKKTEKQLREILKNKKDYLAKMNNLFKSTMKSMTLKKAYSK